MSRIDLQLIIYINADGELFLLEQDLICVDPQQDVAIWRFVICQILFMSLKDHFRIIGTLLADHHPVRFQFDPVLDHVIPAFDDLLIQDIMLADFVSTVISSIGSVSPPVSRL